jgi:hypothetical protein
MTIRSWYYLNTRLSRIAEQAVKRRLDQLRSGAQPERYIQVDYNFLNIYKLIDKIKEIEYSEKNYGAALR